MQKGQDIKNRRNYYRMLHVQQDAPTEVIKASYRTLMGKLGHHPDLGGTHAESVLLNEAYHTLCNARKRVEYDFMLSLRQKNIFQSPASRKNQENTASRKSSFKTASQDGSHRGNQKYSTKPSLVERRGVKRIKQQGSLSYTTLNSGALCRGKVLDLSPAGMKFIASEKMDLMTRIKLSSPFLFADAKVVNCRKSGKGETYGYVVGLNFTKVEFERSCGTFLSAKA